MNGTLIAKYFCFCLSNLIIIKDCKTLMGWLKPGAIGVAHTMSLKIQVFSCLHSRPLHWYTVYHYTGQQASILEPVWPFFLFIWYSFRYVFDRIHSNNARNICILRWIVLKTSVLTYKLRTSALLHRREIVTVRNNSKDFLLRRHWGSHSRRHLLNKTMFLL